MSIRLLDTYLVFIWTFEGFFYLIHFERRFDRQIRGETASNHGDNQP
jgi:hypothetical protein